MKLLVRKKDMDNVMSSKEESEKIKMLSFVFMLLVVGCYAGNWEYKGSVVSLIFPSFLLFCAVPYFAIFGFMMFKLYAPGLKW